VWGGGVGGGGGAGAVIELSSMWVKEVRIICSKIECCFLYDETLASHLKYEILNIYHVNTTW
jgi:hypothetical protein